MSGSIPALLLPHTRPGLGVAATQSSHHSGILSTAGPSPSRAARLRRSDPGDNQPCPADLPFARTARNAGLSPGIAVAPVRAGSILMCVSQGPVDPSRHMIPHLCVLFNTQSAWRKALVTLSMIRRGALSERM